MGEYIANISNRLPRLICLVCLWRWSMDITFHFPINCLIECIVVPPASRLLFKHKVDVLEVAISHVVPLCSVTSR